MASMYKLNGEDLKKIKELLNKWDITSERVVIDLTNFTLETESDPYDVTDLLEVSEKITEKRAKELLEHIREVREDWDHD